MSLFGCFGKKEKKVNLESWLAEKFSGEYQHMGKILNLDPKNLYYRKSTSIIALSKDPEVQMVVEWYRDQPDLGLTETAIREGMKQSESDMRKARKIAAALKQKGIDSISVGVVSPAIYFLPYGEPTPLFRNQLLSQLLTIIKENDDNGLTSIWIEFMEDTVYKKEFQDVVPNGYWHRPDDYHNQHKIMWLDFEWSPDLTADKMKDGWEINISSNRSNTFREDAYQQALAWAEKNLSKPYYIEPVQMVEYHGDENDLQSIHIQFPYYAAEPTPETSDKEFEVLGYITGMYDTDLRKYSNIKKVKEL